MRDFETTFDYYAGADADPLVDYIGEIEYPAETIRIYEWRGLMKVVGALVPLSPETRWLDFGCGTGGLVRHCRDALGVDIVGYEQGEGARLAGSAGTPMVDTSQLDALRGTFDVITAIEVLEHLVDPLAELGRIRSLLADGGVFFYTTGNAAPYRNRLNRWRYVIPEIHVSFFEPRTLELALRKSGFVADFRGFPGIRRRDPLQDPEEPRPQEAVAPRVPRPVESPLAGRRPKIRHHCPPDRLGGLSRTPPPPQALRGRPARGGAAPCRGPHALMHFPR